MLKRDMGRSGFDLPDCPKIGVPKTLKIPPLERGDEAIRVVVRYPDEHSQLKMEEFGTVALEALEKAWPCK